MTSQIRGIIVIEGPDGAGKSTLAKTFVHMFGAHYLHARYRFKKKMFTYHTAMLRVAERLAQTGLVVIDRHWLSEEVYAGVYRGGSAWPQAGRMMDRALLKMGAINILCLPDSVEVAVEEHRKNLDISHPYDDETFRKVAQSYFDFWNGSIHGLPDSTYSSLLKWTGGACGREDWIRYNKETDGVDMGAFCRSAVSYLMAWRGAQYVKALDCNEQNVLGNMDQAFYLMIGDEVNAKPQAKRLQWPFHEYGNSSLFMADVMQDLRYTERDLMWVNCNGPNGLDHIKWILSQKPSIKGICLGDKAHSAVLCLGEPFRSQCREVWHPSYVRRFGKRDEFLQQLKGALKW